MSVFSIPFRFDPALGKAAVTSIAAEVWRARIRNVLLSYVGSRVMRPDYGTDLNTLVFEDQFTAVELGQKMISTAFNQWLPSLNLLEVLPDYDSYTGTLVFNIIYALPDGRQDEVSVSTGAFDMAGNLIQEINRG